MNPYAAGILGIVLFYCVFGIFGIQSFIFSAVVEMKKRQIKNELAGHRKNSNELNIQVRTYKQYTPPTLTPRERAKLKRKAINNASTNEKTAIAAKTRPVPTTKKLVTTTKKPNSKNNPVIRDVVGGLVGLGISKSEAKTLVEKTYNPAIANAEELFAKCLRKMNN